MRLIVWILEPDAAVAADLAAAWRSVAGDRVTLRVFTTLPDPSGFSSSSNLSGFSNSSGLPDADLPDLLMAEIDSICVEVTELLQKLRCFTSTDFLPVTRDRSPSSFTRAQQLGAIDYILKPFTSRRLRRSLRRYLSLKQGLSAGCALTQGQLDHFFFSGDSRYSPALSSFSEVELRHCRRVLEALVRFPKQQCTAEEMATALILSRVTARKYLDRLVQTGCVNKMLLHNPSGAGRPRHIYQFNGDY